MARIAVILLIAASLGMAQAEETEAKSFDDIFNGQHQDQLINLFGAPSRTLRHGGKTILIFKPRRQGTAHFRRAGADPAKYSFDNDQGRIPQGSALDSFLDNSDRRAFKDKNTVVVGESLFKRVEVTVSKDGIVESGKVKFRRKMKRRFIESQAGAAGS